MGTAFVEAVRKRLTTPPLTLVASLTAALAFGVAVLVGWVTAHTREDLRHARPLPRANAPPALVLLGAARALPPAPPPRSAARTARPAKVPRLIVGSG